MECEGHRLLSEAVCATCGPVEPGVWREATAEEYRQTGNTKIWEPV